MKKADKKKGQRESGEEDHELTLEHTLCVTYAILHATKEELPFQVAAASQLVVCIYAKANGVTQDELIRQLGIAWEMVETNPILKTGTVSEIHH